MKQNDRPRHFRGICNALPVTLLTGSTHGVSDNMVLRVLRQLKRERVDHGCGEIRVAARSLREGSATNAGEKASGMLLVPMGAPDEYNGRRFRKRNIESWWCGLVRSPLTTDTTPVPTSRVGKSHAPFPLADKAARGLAISACVFQCLTYSSFNLHPVIQPNGTLFARKSSRVCPMQRLSLSGYWCRVRV